MRGAGRYLVTAGLATAACILVAAAINVVVDPYGFYRWIDVAGFNAVKPRAGQQAMRNKVYGIAATNPDAIVLGNSRAEIGFDPHSRAWPAGSHVYNAGVPGVGMEGVAALMQLAVSRGNIKVALIGIDFLDFVMDAGDDPRSAPAAAFRGAATDVPASARDAVTAVLSLDALGDSLLTLLSQHDRYSATVTAQGFNPMHEYEAIAAAEGYHALFAQRNLENARSYVRSPLRLEAMSPVAEPAWAGLERMKDLCIARSVRCAFVIYPYHADILEMLDAAGLWPLFERWKRELVAVLTEPADAASPPVVLWDFSGYDEYTTEPVPPARDVAAMRWYWEAGHFKAALGDRILRRLYQDDAAGFGTRLDAADIDADLDRIRTARERYRTANPSASQAIQSLVQRVRGR